MNYNILKLQINYHVEKFDELGIVNNTANILFWNLILNIWSKLFVVALKRKSSISKQFHEKRVAPIKQIVIIILLCIYWQHFFFSLYETGKIYSPSHLDAALLSAFQHFENVDMSGQFPQEQSGTVFVGISMVLFSPSGSTLAKG